MLSPSGTYLRKYDQVLQSQYLHYSHYLYHANLFYSKVQIHNSYMVLVFGYIEASIVGLRLISHLKHKTRS